MLRLLGRACIAALDFVGQTYVLLRRASAYVAVGAVSASDTAQQMVSVGVHSVPVVVVTVAFSGMVLAYYTAQVMLRYGAAQFVGGLVAEAVVREMGPVLTATVVAARAGSAMAAQIGSMKVTEQIDALRALAVSPVRYLVAPRLLAAVVMVPVLAALADIVGVAGGYVSAAMAGVSATVFVDSVAAHFDTWSAVGGLIKTVVFGALVAIVGCQQGLATGHGAAAVGRATTNSVVLSIMLIYMADLLLTVIIFP